MTGPNEPQDAQGQTPPEPKDPWAPTPAPGGGEQPGSSWSAPHNGQQWAPGAASGWGPPPAGESAPAGWGAGPGEAQPNPWAAPAGASNQPSWAAPAPQHPGTPQHPGPQPHPGPQGWGAPAPGWGQQPPGGPQSWGAPGQPHPAPGWGAHQPGGPQNWGAPANGWQQPGPAPQQNGRSKLPWILGGVGVVVVLAIVGILAATVFGDKVLDDAATEAGIAKVLTESYGAGQVGDVQCPSDQAVEAGHRFTCEATVDGQFREVTVTVTDDNGTYEVGRPN